MPAASGRRPRAPRSSRRSGPSRTTRSTPASAQRRRDVDRARAAAEHRAMADRREHAGPADARRCRRRACRRSWRRRRCAARRVPISRQSVAPLQAHLAARRRRGHARRARRSARAGPERWLTTPSRTTSSPAGCFQRDRRRAEQPRARRRGGEAQHLPGVDDARRAAGDIDAELARDLGDDPLAGLRTAPSRCRARSRADGRRQAARRIVATLP